MDDEGDLFCPRVTSTPNNSQTDQRNPIADPSILLENDWHTIPDSTEKSMFFPQDEDQSASTSFFPAKSVHLNPPQRRSLSSRVSLSFDQGMMDWRTLSSRNDPGIDPNNTFKNHVQRAPRDKDNDDEDWKVCFTNSEKQSSRKPAASKRKRKRNDSNKENVAIKNVKKLIMYVNNY